jgi:hypothetical protein
MPIRQRSGSSNAFFEFRTVANTSNRWWRCRRSCFHRDTNIPDMALCDKKEETARVSSMEYDGLSYGEAWLSSRNVKRCTVTSINPHCCFHGFHCPYEGLKYNPNRLYPRCYKPRRPGASRSTCPHTHKRGPTHFPPR